MKKAIIKLQLLSSILASMMALTGCSGFVPLPGRPLRIEGEVVSTGIHLKEGSHWARGHLPDPSNLDESTRKALEVLWLQDARGEHASVFAFSRISWQLAMLGAPSELIEWAHKAALQEINHARLCFALAEGYGGRSYFVQSIPEMLKGGLDITDDPIEVIATETIFDGCLIEGFFANVASIALIQCEEPATLAALEQIAPEEKSHHAFSWALLEWLLEQYPNKVKAIIQEASHKLKTYSRPTLISWEYKHLLEKAEPELLIKHGRLPDEQWQEIWNHHLIQTQKDLQQLLRKESVGNKNLPL